MARKVHAITACQASRGLAAFLANSYLAGAR
jgi:hypothetical protein